MYTDPGHHRSHRRRYDDEFEPRAPRPQRRRTYREPHPYSSASESSSPPRKSRHHQEPRRPAPRHRQEPLPHGEPRDRRAPRRHHTREDDYFSDNRHNRPRRDPHDDGYDYVVPKDRRRGGHDRERERELDRKEHRRQPPPSKPERKESKWQKEAKDMFKEYAVPVIKAEGGKYISKQIGALIAKQAA